MKTDEAKMRREGIPLTAQEAKAVLDFIEISDPSHSKIEAEIVVKLELLSGVFRIAEREET